MSLHHYHFQTVVGSWQERAEFFLLQIIPEITLHMLTVFGLSRLKVWIKKNYIKIKKLLNADVYIDRTIYRILRIPLYQGFVF